MSQYPDSLFSLRGRVQQARPQIDPILATSFLNDRLRQILDQRTIWADLMAFGILSFPDPYITGTVTLATGSKVVTGTDTAWPVNDVVNTTITDAVSELGYVTVTPAAMTGITANSMLYVDAAGNAETVPVVEVGPTSFTAIFAKSHTAGATITQSSLVNRQLRITQAYPIFTVYAVTSATTLELNMAWGGPALADQTYQIKVMYVVLAPDLKGIIAAKDEQSGYPVRLHVELAEPNTRDPRRTLVTGNPFYSLVDLGANAQGNMMYEVWPAPSNARQFSYAYWKQWPDLSRDTDRPPPFINPSIIFYGALADAKMMRVSKDDPYYDPAGARYYEQKFQEGMLAAKNSDEAKMLQAMRNPWWNSMMPGAYDQQQLTDPSTMGFWSGAMY